MDFPYPAPPRKEPAKTHRKKLVRPPPILNSKPSQFVYPAGSSPLEAIFPHNPILSCLIDILTTPALLSLYCTCRTLRYYLHGQRRYFRNLLLVPDAVAEQWVELKAGKGLVRRSETEDVGLGVMWSVMITNLIDKQTVLTPRERELTVKGYLWDLLKDDPILPAFFHLTELESVMFKTMLKLRNPKTSFPRLMSRHLYALLQSLPAGRRLTTLVLDGTGVETEYMKFVLPQIEGTLRGLSVKRCPNLECYTWSEWLLEALEETRPIALQRLYIWGSGNTPTTDFDFTRQPIPLEPLDIHENDPPCWEFPRPDEWGFKPSPFANVLPINFHIHNTLDLLPAMTLTNTERLAYLTNLRTVVTAQYRNYLSNRHRDPTAHWDAPKFPLGEPHPLIALLAIAKYSSITLDVAFCVSRRDCYSFIYGRPYWQHINRLSPRPSTSVTVVQNATGRTIPLSMVPPDGDAVGLHTHCVAEVGARKAEGGTVCQNCGLWEDELSPEKFRQEGIVKEYAGIKWGSGIGDGRMAIGSCCTDCVREMTCAGCNSFYCPSCLFQSPLTTILPPNPLAAEPPSLKFLKWTCPQAQHGPYCEQCMESGDYYMTCIDCNTYICYGCHGPSGFTISSSLYTNGGGWDTDQENEHFGVVGSIDEWEEGGYLGWSGTRPDEEDDDGEDGDEDEDPNLPDDDETPTKYNNWKQPTPSDCQIDNSDEEMEDPESWKHDLEQLSSDHDITPDRSSPYPSTANMNFTIPDAGEAILMDTTPLRIQHPRDNFDNEDHHENMDMDMGDDWRSYTCPSWKAGMLRMSETRIWESCAQCGVKTCAGCLGYEEADFHAEDPRESGSEPEYRSCSGGCGRRFCDNCLTKRGKKPSALVCGAIWDEAANEKDLENDRQEGSSVMKTAFRLKELLNGMAGVPGHGVHGGKGGKGGRCGAVLCIWCQCDQVFLAPTICQGIGDVEESDPMIRKEGETSRRLNDRRGVWRCVRCELGMKPLPL